MDFLNMKLENLCIAIEMAKVERISLEWQEALKEQIRGVLVAQNVIESALQRKAGK